MFKNGAQLKMESAIEQVDGQREHAPAPDALVMGGVFYDYVAAEMRAS